MKKLQKKEKRTKKEEIERRNKIKNKITSTKLLKIIKFQKQSNKRLKT